MKKEMCKICTYYNAFYNQRSCGYEKLSYGTCSICKEQRKKNDVCEKFKFNELKEKRRKENLYLSLECAAKSIRDIVHIIKEKEDIDFMK